jgi:hypothetical protein
MRRFNFRIPIFDFRSEAHHEIREDTKPRRREAERTTISPPALSSLCLRAFVSSWLIFFCIPAVNAEPPAVTKAPFPYVPAIAYHVMPETTTDESGYFSLCEGLDGKVYVGTAKYGINAFLVEFDPTTSKQRIVVDTNKVTGATGKEYASQSKIHTRNFVGPSGKIYVGSKQGYRRSPEDKSEYPGGYAMVYDPRTDTTESLGMPFAGQGVIDTVADEARGLVYVVTCEEQHWMLYDVKTKKYRELGPMLTPYATTLVDSRGVASAITKDFQLAQYDPAADRVTTRPIQLDSAVWSRKDANSIPTWYLAPDGKTAYLILMNDPTLVTIDLQSAGPQVAAKSHGKLLEGEAPDSRSSLVVDPQGVVWALVRVNNTTGFGGGYLHHLARFDPAKGHAEDLGVLAVKNPDFFDWSPGPDGKQKPWTHGFHKLPDGTMTILHAHMGLIRAHDGTIYVTALYPYTLLKIEGYKPAPPPVKSGARYLDDLLKKLDGVEAQLPQITAAAEVVADRYIKGGNLLMPWMGGSLEQELAGRSGGLMTVPGEATGPEDVGIVTWDRAPGPGDLAKVQEYKKRGLYVMGFGPRGLPALAEHVKLADAWFDSGEETVGHSNPVINAALGWAFTGELIAALTRRGKMPVMLRAWACEDGKAWSAKYAQKKRLHDDVAISPIAPGELARKFLDRARYGLQRLENTQLPALEKIADTIAVESAAGRKTIVAYNGHMGMCFVAQYEDANWAVAHELHEGVEGQTVPFEKERPEGALVLRLGAFGLHDSIDALLQKKKERVMLVTSENPRLEWAVNKRYEPWIDFGMPHGDACVHIDGYPIPVLPVSGVTQTATYECINVEVQSRLHK